MTIAEVMSVVQVRKPHAVTNDDLVAWLNELESYIVLQVYDETEYISLDPAVLTRELKVPEQFERIYSEFLIAKIDNYNEDMESYSMSSRTYNNTISDFEKYIVRENLSVKPTVTRFTNFK